jgi:hypothetical protein
MNYLAMRFPKTLETFMQDASAAQIGGVVVADQPQIGGMSVYYKYEVKCSLPYVQ